MTIFLDSANIEHMKQFCSWGVVQGITTNPKILSRDGISDVTSLISFIEELFGNVPISVEITNIHGTLEDIIHEAEEYSKLSKNVVVKVPAFTDGRGLVVSSRLKKENIPVNMTCEMTINQMLLSFELNVEYASLFLRRSMEFYRDRNIDDTLSRLKKISQLKKEVKSTTKIIVGSVRDPEDVWASIYNGADVVTVPPKILSRMTKCLRTDETIEEFDKSWRVFGRNV